MPRRVACRLVIALTVIVVACSPEGPERTPMPTPTPTFPPPPFEITVTELPESVFHPAERTYGTERAWDRNFAAVGPPRTPLNALDAEGGVVVAQSDGGLAADGDWGIVLARYHADGSLDWGRRYSSPLMHLASGLAIADGTIYLGGSFNLVTDFGLGPLQAMPSQAAFIAAFNLNGEPMWVRAYGGRGGASLSALALTEEGDLLASGIFAIENPFTGEPGPLGFDSADVYITRLTAEGDPIWSTRVGNDRRNIPYGMVVAPGDQVTMATVDLVADTSELTPGRIVRLDGDGAIRSDTDWSGLRLSPDIESPVSLLDGRAVLIGRPDTGAASETCTGVLVLSLDDAGEASSRSCLPCTDCDGVRPIAEPSGEGVLVTYGDGVVDVRLGLDMERAPVAQLRGQPMRLTGTYDPEQGVVVLTGLWVGAPSTPRWFISRIDVTKGETAAARREVWWTRGVSNP